MSTGNTKAPYHLDRLRKNADPLLEMNEGLNKTVGFLTMALPARKPVISSTANPASACSEGEFLTPEVGMIVPEDKNIKCSRKKQEKSKLIHQSSLVKPTQ